MDRAERNALPPDLDPMRFRNSFMNDFSMLAVTGAIVAQVAITALALPSLNRVHWISNAAFVVSLVFACLSVFFSTTMARNLSSLDTPNEVRDWLSKPAPKIARLDFNRTIRPRLVIAHLASDDERNSLQSDVTKFLEDNKWKETSFYSCAMLSAPSILLSLSLALFLTALGIYLGTVWDSSLDPVAGDVASRAVMICYLVSTTSGIAIFFGPSNRKDAESAFLRNWIAKLEPRPTIGIVNSDPETGHQSPGENTQQQISVGGQGE
jgi:hypothetical protein